MPVLRPIRVASRRWAATDGFHRLNGGRRPTPVIQCPRKSTFERLLFRCICNTAPPQARHVSTSILDTRLRRWAQVMAARRSAGVRSCACSGALGLLPLPRFAGVTCSRYLLLGANTPCKRVRLTLGLGTRAASAAIARPGAALALMVNKKGQSRNVS